MVSIHVEGENVSELIDKTLAHFGLTIQNINNPKITHHEGPSDPVPSPPLSDPKVTPIEEGKKKRGRRTKAEIEAALKAPVYAPPTSTPPAPAPTPPATPVLSPFDTEPLVSPEKPVEAPLVTHDAVRAAFQKLVILRGGEKGQAGTDRVREILSRYGVKKIGALLPETFASVIADCEKA